MQKIISAFILLIIISCTSTSSNFGEKFEIKNPLSVDEIVHNVQIEKNIQNTQIKGKIEKCCMQKGCWLIMKTNDGKELLMNFKNEKFTVPINCGGKNIIATGSATYKKQSILEQKAIIIASNENLDDTLNINNDKEEYNFIASGLVFE